MLSTRSKVLQWTNCGLLSWYMPYSKAPIDIVEMSLPAAQRQTELAAVLRRLKEP